MGLKTAAVGFFLLVCGYVMAAAVENTPNSPYDLYAGFLLLGGIAVMIVGFAGSLIERARPKLPVLKPANPRASQQEPAALQGQTTAAPEPAGPVMPASQVPLILPLAFQDRKNWQRNINAILAVTAIPLVIVLVVLVADFQVGLGLLGLVGLMFLGLYIATMTRRRSTVVKTFASAVTADADAIVLPEGISAARVVIGTSGYYDRGYQSSTNVTAAQASPAGGRVAWRDNPWGAVVDTMGAGWFEALGWSVTTDGPFKDMLMVPVQPSNLQGQYSVSGEVDGDSASAQIEVKGPVLTGSLQRSPSEHIRTYQVRIHGESGKMKGDLNIDSTGEFKLQTQPGVPLVLIAHRKMLNPRVIMQVLEANRVAQTLYGGTGMGSFTMQLVLNTHIGRGHTFSSQPIPY